MANNDKLLIGKKESYKTPKVAKKNLYKKSDLSVENAIDRINNDIISIQQYVNQIINALQSDIRLSEQQRFINLRNRIDEIVKNKFNNYSPTEQQKKNFISSIKKHIQSNVKLTQKTKQEIISGIEYSLDGIGASISEEINKKIDTNLKNTLSLSFDNKKKIYENILSNKFIIISLGNKIKNAVFNKTSVNRSLMTLNAQLDRFKRINKSLFRDDFNKKTFSKIANQKNPYNSFLDKYNYITEHIFGQKIKSINRLSFEQMVQNQFSRNLKRKILRDLKRWTNSKNQLLKFTKKGYWNRKIQKIGDQFYLSFKHGTAFSILDLFIKTPVQLFNKVLFGVTKLSFNLLLKTALVTKDIVKLGFKLGYGLIKGMFKLPGLIIGTIWKTLKGIIGITGKIIKNTVGLGMKLFKFVQFFLFTPSGAYILGFICGFLYERIKQFVDDVIEKIDKSGIIRKTIEWWEQKKKDFNEWENSDEQSYVLDVYHFMVDKMKAGMDFFRRMNKYADIFRNNNYGKTKEDRARIFDQLKINLNDDTGYAQGIVNIESKIISLFDGLFGSGESINELLSRFQKAYDSNEFEVIVSYLKSPGETVLRKVVTSGVMGFAKALPMIGATIGSTTGIVGAILGGTGAGIISSIAQVALIHAVQNMPYSPSGSMDVNSTLVNINRKYAPSNTENVKLKNKLKDEHKYLTDELKANNNLTEDQRRQKEKRLKQIELQIGSIDNKITDIDTINERLQNIGYEKFLLMSPVEIFDYVQEKNDQILNGIKGIPGSYLKRVSDNYGNIFKATFIAKSDVMKKLMLNLLIDYNYGRIEKDQIFRQYDELNNRFQNQYIIEGKNGYYDIKFSNIVPDYKERLEDLKGNRYLTFDPHGQTRGFYNDSYDRIKDIHKLAQNKTANKIKYTLFEDFDKEMLSYRTKSNTDYDGIFKQLRIAIGKDPIRTEIFDEYKHHIFYLIRQLQGDKKQIPVVVKEFVDSIYDIRMEEEKIKQTSRKTSYRNKLFKPFIARLKDINKVLLPSDYDFSKALQLNEIDDVDNESKLRFTEASNEFNGIAKDYRNEVEIQSILNEYMVKTGSKPVIVGQDGKYVDETNATGD